MNLVRHRKLKPLLAELQIQQMGFHEFRHFNGSFLHELGVKLKVIVDRLGHTSAESFLSDGDGIFTMDAHVQSAWKQNVKAANRPERAIERAVNSVRLASHKENGSGVEAPKPLYLN